MRIRYIEIFYAVMQSGTVKGAAEMLHITQPAATRLLQQAEAHVGVPLFQRVRGRLVPTAEAHQLIPEVEQLYLKLDAVRRVVANLGQDHEAMLRVLCVPGLALEALPQALGRWSRRRPRARFSLRTLHSRQIAESLALREAEVGFAFEPSPHPALLNQAIAQGRLVCVGSALRGDCVPLEALGRHPVIDLDPADPLGRLLHAACLAHDVQPQSRVLAHSYHAAVELAVQGFGWALLDSVTAHYAHRHPRLRVLPLAPEIPVTVYALRPRDLPSSVAAEELVARMGEVLRGLGPPQLGT
ncbi:MAG: LysR family transcriptional regulator [Pseudomonadota bacterium]